jgi:hypothetical protein
MPARPSHSDHGLQKRSNHDVVSAKNAARYEPALVRPPRIGLRGAFFGDGSPQSCRFAYPSPTGAKHMRCYLMRNGHIAAVELLDVKSDEEAVEKCRALFEERKPKFEEFEVWDRTRKIARGPRREDDAYTDG